MNARVLKIRPQSPPESPEEGLPLKEAYSLIPEGLYLVQFVRADPVVRVFGADGYRLYLHWLIMEMGPCFETELFQSFQYYNKWPFRSKFYCNWTVANGGQKPRARTRMSCAVFKGKIFRAQISTAKPKYQHGPLKGKAKPASLWYSVVDELLEIVGP